MKKRATKRQAKYKLRQHAIDAGGVVFIAIENCTICKVKHLNARGIKTRIPKRSHHKACSKNLKTRGTSEMTVFVNKEAARNLASNRAAIANKTINKLQKDVLSTYQGFFAESTNHPRTKRAAMVRPSMTSTLPTAVKDGSFSITKEKLSDATIQYLRHSKRWKQRYSKFLRKLILPGATQDIASICGSNNLKMREIKETNQSSLGTQKKLQPRAAS
jgi:hypothetical protein